MLSAYLEILAGDNAAVLARPFHHLGTFHTFDSTNKHCTTTVRITTSAMTDRHLSLISLMLMLLLLLLML
jgi:hypothetical protein